MSFIAWLKKHVCEDDAWITVHPNASGPGSPVLLDDEGYIKGGMGGKFTGQRIDLMPRKTQTMPESGLNATEWIKRYNLKNGTRREQLQHVFRGITDPVKNKETAIAFYNAPDDLIYALGQQINDVNFKVGTGKEKTAGYWDPRTKQVVIGAEERTSSDTAAKGRYSDPAFVEYNNGDGTIRHEFGHALDDKMQNAFLVKELSKEDWVEERLRYVRGEIAKAPNLREYEAGGDNGYASSNSKAFVDGCKAAEKKIWTRLGVGKGKVPNAEIAQAFGLKHDGYGGYYADKDASGPVLSKCAPLSDILAALSGGKLGGFWKHSDGYWRSGGMPARRTEIFANLTNLYASSDKRGWNEAERLFPELTNSYKEVLARARTKARKK